METDYGCAMSQNVPLDELEAVSTSYGDAAYAVVNSTVGAPRVTHVRIRFVSESIEIVLGRGAATAVRSNPSMSLVWPATDNQSMSLIADGQAEVLEEPAPETAVRVRVTGAVRHRPAP